MSAELRVGDIGTRLIATMYDGSDVKDVSLATTKQFVIKKPSGTLVTVDASFLNSGSDGKIYYATVAGTFDEAGYYKIQAYLVIGSNSWRSDVYTFRVYPNL